MIPFRNRQTLLLDVVSNVVTSLGPVRAEVAAKSTTPARASHAALPGRKYVGLLVTPRVVATRSTSMRLHVVCGKILLEEVDCGAEVAFEHLQPLLIGFLVPFPVCLFHKRPLAARAKILVFLATGPGLLASRYARSKVILILRGWPSDCPPRCS